MVNNSRCGFRKLAEIKFVESFVVMHLVIFDANVKPTVTVLYLSRFSFGIFHESLKHMSVIYPDSYFGIP